ncbi:MAG: hypothetical protein AAF645_20945 [Myxococcota bacterium]
MGQLAHIERTYGPQTLEAGLRSLDAEDQEHLAGMVSLSWVPVGSVQRYKAAVAERLSMHPDQLQREAVRASIGAMLNTVWRVLLRTVSDSALIKRTPILYGKTFDRGRLSTEAIGSGYASIVLEGWPGIPEYDCLGLATGIEAVLQYAGRHDARLTWKRTSTQVRFTARWTAF